MAMLPKEYGGAGFSCLNYVIACEEITAIDPGFACTCLCNGLGLMPVLWYGSDDQKKRFLGAATSDPTGTYLSAWTAGEPPGGTGGTANFDSPLPKAGIGMTAVRDGDHFIINGKKKWSSSAGWDGLGTNTQTADHSNRQQRRRNGRVVRDRHLNVARRASPGPSSTRKGIAPPRMRSSYSRMPGSRSPICCPAQWGTAT